MRCTAVKRVSKVGFDWIFEIRVGKLMHITCVFNAFSTRIRQGQIDGEITPDSLVLCDFETVHFRAPA